MASRKRKRRSTKRKTSGGGRFKAMLLGLVAGIVIAVAVWWQLGQPAAPSRNDGAPVEVATAPAEAPEERPPAKIVDLEPTGRDFDFYAMLPEQEIVVDDRAKRNDTNSPASPDTAAISEPGTYRLQAGSFTREADAEAFKARLALLGMQSAIQPATVNGQRYYRVIIGPMTNTALVNEYKRRLNESGIETIVSREKS
ncbi:MAG: SPOR domain-containing protein [Pseudomonadota bacterium]